MPYNEHICYPEEIEELMERGEHFKVDPEWSFGRAFAELDKWRVKQAYPNLSDAERAKINPMELRAPAPGASMLGAVEGLGALPD